MMKSIHPARLRLAAVVLLAASTPLFAIGVTAERSAAPQPTATSSSESTGHVEGAGPEGSAHAADSGAGEQRPAGLDLEGVPTVVAAVLVSAAAAGGLWFWWRRQIVLVMAALLAAGFAALDVREVIHQVSVTQPFLAVLAGTVVALHAATAVVVIALMRAMPRSTRAAA